MNRPVARSIPTDGPGRRLRRRLAAVGAAAALAVVVLLVALRREPAACRATPPAGPDAERASARLVTKASAISAGLGRRGEWGEAITDGEVNAWLAHDLRRVAASLLPAWVGTPTVRFLPRRVALSVPLGAGPLAGRAWAILAVALPRANELVIEIESAGLGAFPLPAEPLLDGIASRALAAGMAADIRRSEGRTSLHVVLPGRPPGARDTPLEYHLEGLRIDDGELVLSGSTRSLPR